MTTFTAWFQRAIVPKVSQQKPSLSNSKWRSSSSTEKGLFRGLNWGYAVSGPWVDSGPNLVCQWTSTLDGL